MIIHSCFFFIFLSPKLMIGCHQAASKAIFCRFFSLTVDDDDGDGSGIESKKKHLKQVFHKMFVFMLAQQLLLLVEMLCANLKFASF